MKLFSNYFIFFFACFSVREASCQNFKIDSLRSILPGSESIQRVVVLRSLAHEYRDLDHEQTVTYSREAYVLASRIGDSLQIVETANAFARALRKQEKHEESIDLLKLVYPIAERNQMTSQAAILNDLAVSYTFQADYDEALRCNFKSLALNELNGDVTAKAVSFDNIGHLYYKMEYYQKALEYYTKSQRTKKEIGYLSEPEFSFLNIGLCHINLNKFSEGQKYITQAFAACGDSCSNVFKMEANCALGRSFFNQHRLREAENYLRESYETSLMLDNKRYQAENQLLLAQVFRSRKDNKEARTLLTETLNTAEKFKMNEIVLSVYREFMNIYRAENDLQNLSHYQTKFIELNESIYSEEMDLNLSKLQADFDEQQYLRTMALQQQMLTFQESSIRNQKYLGFTVACIGLLLLTAIVILFRNNHQKSQLNHLLNIKVEERTRELETNQQVVKQANQKLLTLILYTVQSIKDQLPVFKNAYGGSSDGGNSFANKYSKELDYTAGKLQDVVLRMESCSRMVVEESPVEFKETAAINGANFPEDGG